jgi:hypothetical protein
MVPGCLCWGVPTPPACPARPPACAHGPTEARAGLARPSPHALPTVCRCVPAPQITQFGLINKISTGNGMVDVLCCMLVPILLRNLLPKLTEFVTQLFKRTKCAEKVFSRVIEHTQRSGYYW